MSHWKKILAPVDFSPASATAVHLAAKLAAGGAPLALVHVVAPSFEGLRIHTDEHHQEAVKQAEERLAAFAKEHAPGAANLALDVIDGSPGNAICDHAAKTGSDLIVISNQGHGALAHALLGSTTERVVRHAKCQVLVVR